jgi:hypothetical protein
MVTRTQNGKKMNGLDENPFIKALLKKVSHSIPTCKNASVFTDP